MTESETSDTKTCPDCNTVNAMGNLRCIKCGTNLLNVPPTSFWKEGDNAPQAVEGISTVLNEIFVTVIFLFTTILGIYGSRWFLLIALILMIIMIKNNYYSFLIRVLTNSYRK